MINSFAVLLVLLLLFFCPAQARADEFRLVPSISVKQEYNSNIMFSANNIRSDYITTLSPGFELVDNNDRLNTDVMVRLDRLEYAENKSLSATNQNYNGKFRYFATPKLGISAEGIFTRNANPSLTIAPTGIITAAAPWEHATASLSADYQLSEVAAAVVSYAYGRDHFEGRSILDDVSHDFGTGLVYDLGKYFRSTKGRVNLGYSYLSFPGSRIDTVTGTVGCSRDLNEVWSLSIDGGIRHTNSETSFQQSEFAGFQIIDGQILPFFLTSTNITKHAGWGWVGKLSLDYKGEHGTSELAVVRDITPAYGFSGAAERNALTLSTQYRLTYELYATFSGGYYALKSGSSQFSTQTIDRQTLYADPGLRYEFTKDIAAEASYSYSRVHDTRTNFAAQRHVISGRLYIQHPFFE